MLALFLLLPALQSTRAGSATWSQMPADNDWYNVANWKPRTIPETSADTATFGTSSITAISITAITPLDGIVFQSGASAYTLKPSDVGSDLEFDGAGVTNNS